MHLCINKGSFSCFRLQSQVCFAVRYFPTCLARCCFLCGAACAVFVVKCPHTSLWEDCCFPKANQLSLVTILFQKAFFSYSNQSCFPPNNPSQQAEVLCQVVLCYGSIWEHARVWISTLKPNHAVISYYGSERKENRCSFLHWQ